MIAILIIISICMFFLHYELAKNTYSNIPTFGFIFNGIFGFLFLLNLFINLPIISYFAVLILIQVLYFSIGGYYTYKLWQSIITERMVDVNERVNRFLKDGYSVLQIKQKLKDKYIRNNYSKDFDYNDLIPNLKDHNRELTELFYFWLPNLISNKFNSVLDKIANKRNNKIFNELEQILDEKNKNND